MLKYKCHKVVKAIAMNRLAYYNYRGWDLPENENGSDDGFLVEYINSSNRNHENHEGYISWSPKEVFESGYSLLEDE